MNAPDPTTLLPQQPEVRSTGNEGFGSAPPVNVGPTSPTPPTTTGLTLPIVKEINGQEITFVGLSFRERMNLQVQWRKEKRAELEARLSNAGIIGPEAFGDLNAFDSVVIGEGTWISFFNADEGKLRILKASADKAKPGTGDFAVANYEPETAVEIWELTAAITHTSFGPPKQEQSSPNQQTGENGKTAKGMRPEMQKAFGQL